MRASSSSVKPKRKAQVKPAPKSSAAATNKIDAVAMRKQMAAQRDIEEKERETQKIKEQALADLEQKKSEEIAEEVVMPKQETTSERALSAGSMLFGVEQISDQNANKLGAKIKDNLLEKKNTEKKQQHRHKSANKGGGRQPKVSKFNRRKYLEYKVDVRNMLEEFSIEEEYRSNILGQIWAKGERVGVKEAENFIDQKVEQGIIPEEMVTKLKSLLVEYSKRR